MRALIASFVLAATAAFACDIAAPSTVHKVTVFLDRALIERTATVQLPVGENMVSLDGLTTDLVDESVRVGGTGTAGASITDVNVQPEFLDKANAEEIANRQSEIDELTDELRRHNDRASVIATQREFILALKTPPAPAPGTPRINVKEFQDLVQYVARALNELADQIRDIDAKRTVVKNRLDAATKRLNEIRSQAGTSKKRIIITTTAVKAGTMNLTVSYIVSNASWHPAYDARVNTATGAIDWTYVGTVSQETGENWDNVPLTLSTARPTQGTQIPELSAWFLQPFWPQVASGRGAGMFRSKGMNPAEAGDMASAPVALRTEAETEIGHAAVDIEQHVLSTTFAIASPMSIPSDNRPHKVIIATTSLSGILEHVTVPRLSRDVFLRARAGNSTAAPFLAGEVRVFVDNQFVATASIPTIVPGDSLKLALGANDAISAERRLISKVQEYNGLIAKTYKWNYEFLTTITNNAKGETTIDVLDQLPLSQNEKIIIENRDITPAPSETSDARVMTWHWSLKPGEKREIRVKYSVEYPRDMQVAGME